MKSLLGILSKDAGLNLAIIFLLLVSFLILHAIAPALFPGYFIFFLLGLIFYFIFSHIDFEILRLFSRQMYIASLIFLTFPLIIGQVTRGAVRWIPIGSLTLQPSELVRPFLLIFFADFLTLKQPTFKRFLMSLFYLAIPAFLILIQPSLGVTTLTVMGYFGVLLASGFNKKHLSFLIAIALIAVPIVVIVLAPYQKQRVETFLSPLSDPTGAGYNSLQSMISVGSGRLWGRGLGEGIQTQLSFLPERHTDFIFASVSEEMGFIGASVLLGGIFFLLFRCTFILANAKNHAARCFITATIFTLFVQTFIHVGMNMGMLPITGVPLPLVSAGGSSLLATMTSLGIIVGAKKRGHDVL
jgi:rod shape determining protein RodA